MVGRNECKYKRMQSIGPLTGISFIFENDDDFHIRVFSSVVALLTPGLLVLLNTGPKIEICTWDGL